MSKRDTQPIREPAAGRIDAPHLPDRQPPAPDAVPDEPTAQQLSRQASQLAAHLRASQKEIDHRWSYLNAQTAQLDSDARAARLWLNERTAELDQHDKVLESKSEQLSETLQSKQRQIEQSEAVLTDTQAETQRLNRQLTEARSEVEREGRLQRQQMAAEQRRAQAELEKQRKAVERRADQVDHDSAEQEKLRDKLSKMHRETLETRLATEELWGRLSGVVPPDVLTRSLERIQSKLSEQYRIAGAELNQQKDELQTIRRQVTEQHEKLLEQKHQIEQWAAGRQKELDQQAARLLAREDQLGSREAELAGTVVTI